MLLQFRSKATHDVRDSCSLPPAVGKYEDFAGQHCQVELNPQHELLYGMCWVLVAVQFLPSSYIVWGAACFQLKSATTCPKSLIQCLGASPSPITDDPTSRRHGITRNRAKARPKILIRFLDTKIYDCHSRSTTDQYVQQSSDPGTSSLTFEYVVL
jgi:hypothetical protein